jgi:hypothetical protein
VKAIRPCTCGGRALPLWGGTCPTDVFWAIQCLDCGAEGRHRLSEKQAIQAWNKGSMKR